MVTKTKTTLDLNFRHKRVIHLSVKYVRDSYDVDAVSVEALINLIENNMDYKELLEKYDKYIFKYYNSIILGCTHLLKIPHYMINVEVIDQYK